MNKNGIRTDNTVVGNSRSEGSEEKSLQPKEMSVQYSALNLPEDIIALQTVKAAFRKATETLNDENGMCKEASSHPRIFSVKSLSYEKKKKNKTTELLLKVKIKTIYNPTVVYLDVVIFVATH